MEVKSVKDLSRFIEDGDFVLLSGVDGAGKSSFSLRICDGLSERGYKIVYLSLDHPSFELDLMIAQWNVNPENFEIKDFYEVVRTGERYEIGFERFIEKGKVIVLDSITPFFLFGVDKKLKRERLEYLRTLHKILKSSGGVVIVTVDNNVVEKGILKEIEKLADVKINIDILGGKRKVTIERGKEKIFECIVGYKGEIECK